MEVFILLGSNLGNRLGYLTFARYFLKKDLGEIIKKSAIYETPAWGYESEKDFLNQIVVLKTNYTPQDLLEEILLIEKKAGRRRLKKMSDRTLDIDILYYGDKVINSADLTIPHPFLHQRYFTLQLLNEIAPNLLHPVLLKKTHELLDICEDQKKGRIYLK